MDAGASRHRPRTDRDARRVAALDEGMLLGGFTALREEPRVIPTLLRLTRKFDGKLAPYGSAVG